MFTVTTAREFAESILTTDECGAWHNVAAVSAAVERLQYSKVLANRELGTKVAWRLTEHLAADQALFDAEQDSIRCSVCGVASKAHYANVQRLGYCAL